jgi:hypothetical protein
MAYTGSSSRSMSSAPSLSIVDHTFLVGHHEMSGKPRIAADLLGIGLVAAAVAELSESGSVYLDPVSGHVHPNRTQAHPVPAADYVLGHVNRGAPSTSPAAEWILGLRDDLYTGVAQGLEQKRLIQAQRSALGRTKYQPVRTSLVLEPQSWVYGVLRTPARWTDFGRHQLMVAIVYGAMGVAAAVTAIPAEEVDANFEDLLGRVPPHVKALAKATTQAKVKLSMTVRR